MKHFLLLVLIPILICSVAAAHEVRPAYLELQEEGPGEFSVLWKTPMQGDLRLAISPEFSGGVETLTAPATRLTGGASVQTWRLRAADSLRGRALSIAGLSGTMTDALVRIEFSDGTEFTRRLTPGEPFAKIPEHPTAGGVTGTYLVLGVEHILLGYDHLLFVLALLIITRGGWKIVKTVTAFTVSHSVTLSLAALGYVHLPSAPVEAIIALSIVFVAAEIIRGSNGQEGLTARAPWVVAFAFGLLHGLGFAGALSEIGLPEVHIPLALLFFSIGVETGHFLFVGVVLGLMMAFRRMRVPLSRRSELLPAYAIGSIAMFWLIQRVAGF